MDKVKETKVYEKAQELKVKLSEKREDLDEYLETTQNPTVLYAREKLDAISAPTEMQLALEELYDIDPTFSMVDFEAEMEYDMIPVVIQKYLAGDMRYLETICESNALRSLMGEFTQRQTLGHYYDDRILDISFVQLQQVMFLSDEDYPILQLTFMVQHINCTKDATGQIIDGSDNSIRTTHFLWLMKRDWSGEEFPWKIVEFHAQGVAGYII